MATLDVSAVTEGFISLASGRTLKGNGNVNGKVVVTSISTVAPGSSIRTLTFRVFPTLKPTTLMEIRKVAEH